MTEEKLDKLAEEYIRNLRVAGINSYNHCDVERGYKDGYKHAVKEYVDGTLYKNTIVLQDQDSAITNDIYAVIITNEEPSTIRKIFEDVKDSLIDEWQFEDLIEGLNKNGIDFKIKENISVINY